MRHNVPSHPSLSAIGRMLGGLLALWVLVLSCAVQSPAAHAWLHGTPDAHHDGDSLPHAHPGDVPAESACPVTLFSQGITAPILSPDVIAPESLVVAITDPMPDSPHAFGPERSHPPAQAPPVVG